VYFDFLEKQEVCDEVSKCREVEMNLHALATTVLIFCSSMSSGAAFLINQLDIQSFSERYWKVELPFYYCPIYRSTSERDTALNFALPFSLYGIELRIEN
jgi:hypothetical protein